MRRSVTAAMCMSVYRGRISRVTLAPLLNSIILYILYLGTRWWFWWSIRPLTSSFTDVIVIHSPDSFSALELGPFFNEKSIFSLCLTEYNHCTQYTHYKSLTVLVAFTGIIRCPLWALSVWEMLELWESKHLKRTPNYGFIKKIPEKQRIMAYTLIHQIVYFNSINSFSTTTVLFFIHHSVALSFSYQHKSFCESLVDYTFFFSALQSVVDSETQHAHKPTRKMYAPLNCQAAFFVKHMAKWLSLV